jgi:hypothetical protein
MHPHPYLASCLARQHARELRELAERTRRRPSSTARHRHGRALRQRTGWALVTIGLRLAHAGDR